VVLSYQKVSKEGDNEHGIRFVHVIGAIGYFLSIGIWLFLLVGLRRAQRVEKGDLTS
jgi:hypothetical protein